MQISLLNNVDTLKSTDNATPIELAIMNDVQEFVKLSDYKNINISIGKNGVIYSSVTPEVLEDDKTMSFTLDGNLPFGKYILEVNLIKNDDTVHVVPSQGDFPFTIEKSLNELGETVTLMSVQELISSMEDVKTISEDSNTKVTEAISIANDAKSIVNSALNTANNANATAITADTNATTALNKANQAITTADNANSKATTALSNSQTAIDDSAEALSKANQSISDSSNAVSTANNAKLVADQVRSEFDQIVSGNTDAEVINARTNANGDTFTNVKARLDDSDTRLAQTNSNLSDLQNSFENADKSTVGLDNVDNTSDLNKPISTATQTELDKKIDKSEKGVANGVATLNADGKVVDSDGNLVEGKVTSVNGKIGDVVVDIPTKTSDLTNDSNFATQSDITNVQNEIGILSDTVDEHKAEDATNAKKGHVQLVDDVNGNSPSLVPTQNAVRKKVEQTGYKKIKSSKDSNGVFTVVEEYRKSDNTLAEKSVLSGGTSPKYTTRTITYYGIDGITVEKIETYTLSYDSDDVLTSEV